MSKDGIDLRLKHVSVFDDLTVEQGCLDMGNPAPAAELPQPESSDQFVIPVQRKNKLHLCQNLPFQISSNRHLNHHLSLSLEQRRKSYLRNDAQMPRMSEKPSGDS